MKDGNYEYNNELKDCINKKDEKELYKYFRYLMNIRPCKDISDKYLNIEDEYLQEKLKNKIITGIDDIKPIKDNLYLWKGDITTLNIDSIVNACNSSMLGCFIPLHKCIDNAIHSAAGTRLRLYCGDIIKKQNRLENTGDAKITPAFNLPSKYIIHTVGPIIHNYVKKREEQLLYNCYQSCLNLAKNNNIKSIAFCCISTGEFKFPNELASNIAINSVKDFINNNNKYDIKIIFNVFKDIDYEIYLNSLK